MPTNQELARDVRELEARVQALEAGGAAPSGRRAFVEAIVAAAVASDGAMCLNRNAMSGDVAESKAVRAVVEAEACVLLGLEMLEDHDRLEYEVARRRRTTPVPVA